MVKSVSIRKINLKLKFYTGISTKDKRQIPKIEISVPEFLITLQRRVYLASFSKKTLNYIALSMFSYPPTHIFFGLGYKHGFSKPDKNFSLFFR